MKNRLSSLLVSLQKFGKSVQMKLAAQTSRSKRSGTSAAGSVAESLQNMRMTHLMKSVGAKLFLIFFFCILFFVLTVGLTSYYKSKQVLQNKVADASEQTIIQAGSKLDLIYSTFEDLTMQMMLNEDLRATITNLRATGRDTYDYMNLNRLVNEKLNVYAFSNKSIKAVHLLTETGEPISSTANTMGNDSRAEKDWFKKIIEGNGQAVWLSTQEKGFTDGVLGNAQPTFALGRILKSPSTSQITGVLLIEIGVDTIGRETESISMGEGGSTIIVSDTNTYVYSPNQEQLGKESKLDVPEDAFKERNGKLTSIKGDYQIVYYKSQVNGWNFIGYMPVNELVRDASVIFNLTLGMALGAMVIAVIIGYFIARMIGRPLVLLRNLMKEGEQGNLRVRMDVKSQDEIGQLSVSFNQMMEKITALVQQTNASAQEVLQTAADLSDASKRTAMSAKDISIATEEIANGASSLAVESERGNELTHNIAKQMKSVVEANVIMGTSAGEVQGSSKQGITYMSELIGKTNETESMTRSMVEKVDNLKESTRSIRKILDVLGNMTKQTNILSLNATIEAARAGAAGKGFMVVADEIRKLADQSRQSIAIVGQITEQIQKEIDETVQVLSQAYPIFQEQISSVKEADSIFKQVDTQMAGFIERLSEVTESISQLESSQSVLSDAMANVSAVAQQSSATSEEVASLSSEQLNVSTGLVKLSDKLEELSNSLKESLSKFQV